MGISNRDSYFRRCFFFLGYVMNEMLVTFGGEVKALGDGRFGGYLVRFSSANDPDLVGDFFTKQTDFGIESGQKTPVYFNHRLPLDTKSGGQILVKQKIGEGTMTIDDVGVLIDAIVWSRDNYEKAIIAAGQKDKLGWSSGTAAHLVDSEPAGKARFLKSWQLGFDASLTPIPCEPCLSALNLKSYADAVHAVKFAALDDTEDGGDLADQPAIKIKPDDQNILAQRLNQFIDDHVDDGRSKKQIVQAMAKEAGVGASDVEAVLSGTDPQPADAKLKAFARVLQVNFTILKSAVRRDYAQTIKGMFDAALSERTPSRWELEATYCDVVTKLVSAAATSKRAGVAFDLEGKITEATNEYAERLLAHALAQGRSYVNDSDLTDEPFYLKAAIHNEEGLKKLSTLDLDDHSQLLVSGLRGIRGRFRANHEGRLKAGRVLSEKNRGRLASLVEQMEAVAADMRVLLDESQPMASDAEKRAAQTAYLRLQWDASQLGVSAHG